MLMPLYYNVHNERYAYESKQEVTKIVLLVKDCRKTTKCIQSLTHLCRMDCSNLTLWTGPFLPEGVSG